MATVETPVQFGDGGTVDFSPPSGFKIVFWLLGLGLVGFGIFSGVVGLFDENGFMMSSSGCFAVPGALIVIFTTPTRLQKEYEKIRRKEMPRDFVIRSEQGGSTGSFWTGEYSSSPSQDDRGWVFSAPGPEHWDKEDRYSADEMGILPEHPTVIGTPSPAAISAVGIFGSIIALYSVPVTIIIVTLGIMFPSGDDGEALIKVALMFGPVIGSFGFWFISWQTGTRMQLTQDVPTSKIRSMAAGELELVGQVRRWTSPAPDVQVGNDPARTVPDLHSYHWMYEIYLRRTRVVMTDEGPRTETEYRWETIHDVKGGHPFILHDGTGGVLIKPDSFEVQNLGDHMRVWSVDHNNTIVKALGSIITSTFGGWTILEHKWTLWGLSLGDPCYLLGKAENRPTKEREDGIISRGQHTLMQVVGESGVGFEARLERGSELGVLGKVRSQIEYKIIPGIIAAGALAGTYLAFVNI